MQLQQRLRTATAFAISAFHADWEDHVGSWLYATVQLLIVWWLAARAIQTVSALTGTAHLPGLDLSPFDLLISGPVEYVTTIGVAVPAYLLALGIWYGAGRWFSVDSLGRRFASFYGIAAVVPTVLVAAAGLVFFALSPEPLASTSVVDDFLVPLLQYPLELLGPAGSVAIVAAYRRDEIRWTPRRERAAALVMVGIVVLPALIGGLGVGATTTQPSSVAERMSDGQFGPADWAINDSDVEQGRYQEVGSILACGGTTPNSSAFAYTREESPSKYNYNYTGSEVPSDVLQIAAYETASGEQLRGHYAYRLPRVAAGEWDLLGMDFYNFVEAEGETATNAGISGLAHGKIALENIDRVTLKLRLLSPAGEVHHYRIRLCQPDSPGVSE